MTASADAVRLGLIRRGVPPHIADGFVLNARDESGFDPGINEAAPVVPGSRGGFGLFQWTGPRRKALEAFAASRGKPVSDLDTQLDYLMTELRGPEAAAAESIFAAPDVGTAAVEIAAKFLRPAPEHLERRTAAYRGGPAPRDRQAPAAPVQAVAAAYVNGRMTPDDAALYEQGMREGRFPNVRRSAPEPAPEPDAFQPIRDAMSGLRRFRAGFAGLQERI